jgi:hypothetical protein
MTHRITTEILAKIANILTNTSGPKGGFIFNPILNNILHNTSDNSFQIIIIKLKRLNKSVFN